MNDKHRTTPRDKSAPPATVAGGILKWAVGLAAGAALYALLGFVALPRTILWLAPDGLSEALGRRVEMADVRFNPFTLVLEVEGLAVMEADGKKEFASLALLRADADSLALFRLAAGLEELRLVEPVLRVRMEADGEYNFSDILKARGKTGDGGESDDAPGGGLFPLLGSNLVVQRGRVEFEDRVRGVSHLLEDLELSVPFVSTLQGDDRVYVRPSLTARLNGRPLVLEGRTRPFEDSLRTEFTLALDALDLTRYRPYVPVSRRAALVGGTLSCDLSLVFTRGEDRTPGVSLMGPVTVRNLDVRLDDEPLAGFDELFVHVDGVSLDRRLLSLGTVRLSGPRATVVLDKNGAPVFAPLIPAPETPGDEPDGAKNGGGTGEADAASGQDGAETANKTQKEDKAGGGFGLHVKRFEVADGEVDFRDEARGFRARVTPLALSADGLDTTGGEAPFSLALGLEGRPLLLVDGTLDPAEAKTRGRLTLTGLDVTALAPYYAETLPVELLSCTAGAELAFSVRGGEAPQASLRDLGLRLSGLALRRADGGGALARIKDIRLDGGALDPQTLSGSVEALTLSGASLHPAGETSPGFAALESLAVRGIAFDAGADKAPAASARSLSLGGFSARVPGHADPALGLRKLALDSVAFDGSASSLAVGSISIQAPEILAALDRQGVPNILRILSAATGRPLPAPSADEAENASPTPAAQATAAMDTDAPTAPQTTAGKGLGTPQTPAPHPPALLVRVDSLDLSDGVAAFRDESVSPPYVTALRDFSGTLKGFSNAPGADPADLNLSGMVDGHAPLLIEATASPTDLGLNPRARLTLTDMDLTNFSPYSSKFTSYTLAKGQLTLNLGAEVQGRDLRGDNRIRLRGIELGRFEKSPDDLGIPLPLALALLTDRSGSVELDVPVHGSLDDPAFRLGPVIVKAVLNILFKAVTSPFALIGGLFGGGEDLNALTMAAGSAALSPPLETKLDTMAKALGERPGLKVEVAGTASPGPDRAALTALRLRRAVNAPRFAELRKQGRAPDKAEDIALTPLEYPEFLRRAYEAAPFDKPGDIGKLPEEQALAAMENQLREHLAASDQDATELARRRALAVKDALIARGVEPNRVFLREATDKDAEQAPTGAVLSLR